MFLTKGDRDRLTVHLNQQPDEFAFRAVFDSTRFTKAKSVQWVLKNSQYQCRFFKNGKCGVYDARPTQCRTFPFWPENINENSWDDLKSACPGVDVGKDEPRHSLLKEQVEADKELRKSIV